MALQGLLLILMMTKGDSFIYNYYTIVMIWPGNHPTCIGTSIYTCAYTLNSLMFEYRIYLISS